MGKIKITFFAKLALFGATLIWGSSFIMVKDVVENIPTYYLLTIRFLVAGLILSVVFWKRLLKADMKHIWQGAILGILIFMAYAFQTFGIADTTPGKNAFLTGVYCVIVPFLFWAFDKKRPDRYNIIAALLCISGIGLVSLTEALTIRMGDMLTLCSGFFFALHIVAVAKFSRDSDTILITIFQFWFSGLCALILTLLTESHSGIIWDKPTILSVLYLAVFCTAVALFMQNFGQKYTHPAAASIILSLESVFGAAFSVAFYGEVLTVKILMGFLFIFISILISETKLSFLKKPINLFKVNKKKDCC